MVTGQPYFPTTGNSPSMAKSSSTATVRFHTHLAVPENQSDLELHESDVVWSSSTSSISSSDEVSELPSPATIVSSSPPVSRQFNSGLYAALSEDQNTLVRRKPQMSPSEFAATAARTIPPVAVKRSSEHYHQSAPVNVPVWPKNNNHLRQFDDVDDDVAEKDDEDDDVAEIVPPHEIVARSYVTFSVFEGAGRTLKGRDLCRVRDAVFQKTGFLD